MEKVIEQLADTRLAATIMSARNTNYLPISRIFTVIFCHCVTADTPRTAFFTFLVRRVLNYITCIIVTKPNFGKSILRLMRKHLFLQRIFLEHNFALMFAEIVGSSKC